MQSAFRGGVSARLYLSRPAGAAALLWLLLLAWPARLSALEPPAYRSAVNDLAHLLSESESRRLEEQIVRYRDSTGIEIGILAVESLEGASLEDFAHDVFRTWGIGRGDRDNGVLFLVAWNDHLARLEVGYGLEASLTDLEAGRLVSKRSQMAERFREGDRYGGFEAVVTGIQAAVAGDYDPVETETDTDPPQVALLLFLAFMMFIMFMAAVARRRARRLGVWGHGSWSGLPGGLAGFGNLGGFGRGFGGRSSGGGFRFGGGSSGGGGASGGW
jgi:uncharacterized protein